MSARRRIATIAVAVVVLVVAVLAGYAYRLWHGIERVDLNLAGAGPDATNYLLVGSDAWSGHGRGASTEGIDAQIGNDERADVVMLLHVPREGTPRLVSIPRDLTVDLPGNGVHRLTLALTRGPQLLVDTLCSSFGLGLDHVVMVNLAGFESLVDAAGGVDIEIDEPIREQKLGLSLEPAGRHHLDGRTALQLVRSRHAEQLRDGSWAPVADGADSRLAHSQAVIRALAPRVETAGQSLWGRHQLASALAGTVTVDAGSGIGTLDALVGSLRSVAADDTFAVERIPAEAAPGELDVRFGPGATELLRDLGAGANPRCPNVPILPSVPPPSPVPPGG